MTANESINASSPRLLSCTRTYEIPESLKHVHASLSSFPRSNLSLTSPICWRKNWNSSPVSAPLINRTGIYRTALLSGFELCTTALTEAFRYWKGSLSSLVTSPFPALKYTRRIFSTRSRIRDSEDWRDQRKEAVLMHLQSYWIIELE